MNLSLRIIPTGHTSHAHELPYLAEDLHRRLVVVLDRFHGAVKGDVTVTFGQRLLPMSCGMTQLISYKRHRFRPRSLPMQFRCSSDSSEPPTCRGDTARVARVHDPSAILSRSQEGSAAVPELSCRGPSPKGAQAATSRSLLAYFGNPPPILRLALHADLLATLLISRNDFRT